MQAMVHAHAHASAQAQAHQLSVQAAAHAQAHQQANVHASHLTTACSAGMPIGALMSCERIPGRLHPGRL